MSESMLQKWRKGKEKDGLKEKKNKVLYFLPL